MPMVAWHRLFTRPQPPTPLTHHPHMPMPTPSPSSSPPSPTRAQPPHPWIAPVVVSAALGFMAISAWMFAPSWERAFRSDGSPVSWLSSALLLTLSATALRLVGERALPRLLGVWLALAWGALALDEQFMLHELWKFRCHEWLSACQWSTVREAPMLAVAVVGLATVAWLHRALHHRSTRGVLWAGLTVGWAAIAVDQWPLVQAHLLWLPELPTALATMEEALEVLAEALVLAALLRQPSGV